MTMIHSNFPVQNHTASLRFQGITYLDANETRSEIWGQTPDRLEISGHRGDKIALTDEVLKAYNHIIERLSAHFIEYPEYQNDVIGSDYVQETGRFIVATYFAQAALSKQARLGLQQVPEVEDDDPEVAQAISEITAWADKLIQASTQYALDARA